MRENDWVNRGALRWTMKLAAIGAITVVLLVGLAMVGGVRRERAMRQAGAEREIEHSWGPSQTIVGPVLRVPVRRWETVEVRAQDAAGNWAVHPQNQLQTRYAWLLPAKLDASVNLASETRSRGIFEAVVYAAEADLRARFEPRPEDFEGCESVLWEEALLLVQIGEGRSLRSIPAFEVVAGRDGTQSDPVTLPVSPGEAAVGWPNSLVARLGSAVDEAPASLECSIVLPLQGTRSFLVAAVAQTQQVTFAGDWPHPHFSGPPLPITREVSADGFEARWTTTEFAREWPRFHLDGSGGGVQPKSLLATTVGVSLLQPVDPYGVVGRSMKYGILFIIAVFTVFLLVEVLGAIRVHPVQYLLVGVALLLFFLGFLALSEVVGVGWGYGLAAAVAVAIVTLYARSVLRAGRRALTLGAGLTLTYLYLFFVLQSESYALLSGSAALFVLLAAVMWATRRVDWYRLGAVGGEASTQSFE